MIKKLLLAGSLLFVGCSDKKDNISYSEPIFKNKNEILEYCNHVSYVGGTCEVVRFYFLYMLIDREACISSSLLCNDYYKSGDYYSDLSREKSYCSLTSHSNEKRCIAFSNIVSHFGIK